MVAHDPPNPPEPHRDARVKDYLTSPDSEFADGWVPTPRQPVTPEERRLDPHPGRVAPDGYERPIACGCIGTDDDACDYEAPDPGWVYEHPGITAVWQAVAARIARWRELIGRGAALFLRQRPLRVAGSMGAYLLLGAFLAALYGESLDLASPLPWLVAYIGALSLEIGTAAGRIRRRRRKEARSNTYRRTVQASSGFVTLPPPSPHAEPPTFGLDPVQPEPTMEQRVGADITDHFREHADLECNLCRYALGPKALELIGEDRAEPEPSPWTTERPAVAEWHHRGACECVDCRARDGLILGRVKGLRPVRDVTELPSAQRVVDIARRRSLGDARAMELLELLARRYEEHDRPAPQLDLTASLERISADWDNGTYIVLPPGATYEPIDPERGQSGA